MKTIIYICASFFCLLFFTLFLWTGGICTMYIIGCCSAGVFLLLNHLYHKSIHFCNMLKSIFHWCKQYEKAIIWTLIIGIIITVLILLMRCFLTDYITNLTDRLFSQTGKFGEQVSDDFIGVVTSVAIGTIISIMTVALPIIVSTMHNLTDRYKTTYVLSLLNQDWTLVVFRVLLILSLGVSVVWLKYYLECSQNLCFVAIILFTVALLLIFSLLVLVARMVYYSMPDKLFRVVVRNIEKVRTPKEYFNPNIYNPFLYELSSPQEAERLKKLQDFDSFDAEKTRLVIIVARLLALYGSDKKLKKEISKFWDETCRKASLIDNNNKKRYTNDYYNFIYELADWAIEHNNAKLQEDTISYMGILLNAHLGKERRYGEIETEEHRKKYYLSYETLECMWKTMRKSVDSLNAEMFQKYWQIVNNFYSRKYMALRNTNSEDDSEKKNAEKERSNFLVVHYLCCSYLTGRKKYNLIEYILHYSQQSNFVWYLIPNDINEVIYTYFRVKEWYSNWEHKEHFSFTEDYNLFADVIISNPIAQFTVLLLLIFEQDAEELKNITIEPKFQPHLKQLCDTINNTDENTDWVKYLHLEDVVNHKQHLSTILESLLAENARAVETIKYTKSVTQNRETKEHCVKSIVSILKRIWSKIKSLV